MFLYQIIFGVRQAEYIFTLVLKLCKANVKANVLDKINVLHRGQGPREGSIPPYRRVLRTRSPKISTRTVNERCRLTASLSNFAISARGRGRASPEALRF